MDIKTGTYTGDGGTSRGITGVGFAPVAVFVMNKQSLWHVCATDAMAAGHSWSFTGADYTDAITSLDADGFTLGDGATVQDSVNKNLEPFWWLAFGAGGATDIATGSYVGDNAGDREITGCGFNPDMVVVVPTNVAFETCYRTAGYPAGESSHVGNRGFQTNQIQAFVADGFQIGSSNEVNFTDATYYWVAWLSDDAYADYGGYTGNGADPHEIATLFDPDFVALEGDDALKGLPYFKHSDIVGDPSYYWGSGQARADTIQELSTGGGNYFELGADDYANKDTIEFEYFIFKDGTTGAAPATLTLTDGFTLADASTLGVRMSFVDGAGAADTMGPRPGLSFADAATWADLLAALSPGLALAEDASLADLLGAQGVDLQLADDATAADALAALRPALSPTDAVGLADTLANPAVGLALLDALGLADLPSLRPYLAAVDAVTWADSLTALRPALALADDATAADTLTFAELAELVLTDGVGVADSLSALRVALSLADALGAGDSLRVMPILALADQVTLADGAVLGVGLYLVDLLGAADTITLRPALAFADGVRLTDALAFPLIWAEGIESEGRLALATMLSEGRLALAYIDSEGRLAIKTFNSDAT